MKKHFTSKFSNLAILGCVLILAGFIMSTLSANTIYRNTAAGDTLLKDITTRPLVSVTMLVAGLAALLTLTSGLISIMKFKERSVLVILATIISALLTLMVVAELIFQH